MFNTKKKLLSPEEDRKQKRGLNNGYVYENRGPVPKKKKKEVLRSKEEILNTPLSIRNKDIPADYFDVIPDDYYPTDDWNL